jgi:hypothetical protein
MDKVFRDWPAVVLLRSNGTLLRDNMSLDGIASREVLATVWARMGLLDRGGVMRKVVALQV